MNGVSIEEVTRSNSTTSFNNDPLYHGIPKYGENDWLISTIPDMDYYVSVTQVYESQSSHLNISVTSFMTDDSQVPSDDEMTGLVQHDVCTGARTIDFLSNDNDTMSTVQRIQQDVVTAYARTSNPYEGWVDGSSSWCLPTLFMGEVGHPNLWYKFTGTGDTVYA